MNHVMEILVMAVVAVVVAEVILLLAVHRTLIHLQARRTLQLVQVMYITEERLLRYHRHSLLGCVG